MALVDPGAASGIVLTVIVPVRNEARFIYQTLTQLSSQSLDRSLYEVIVVDGDSDDATRAEIDRFLAECPGFPLTVLSNPARLSSAARNLAVRASRGRYLLLIDGHVYLPGRDILAQYVRCAADTGAKVLGRPQPLDPPDINKFQLDVAIARSSPIAHSPESFIYATEGAWVSPLSVAVMYERTTFQTVGLFDESFDAAEDLEFNYRVEASGMRCYFSPALAIKYYPRDGFSSLFRQMRRYGLGRARFTRKFPGRFRPSTAAPAGLVGLICGVAIAGVFSRSAGVALFALLGLYGLALLAEGVRLQISRQRGRAIVMASIIATVHVGLGVGFIQGTVGSWRPPRQC